MYATFFPKNRSSAPPSPLALLGAHAPVRLAPTLNPRRPRPAASWRRWCAIVSDATSPFHRPTRLASSPHSRFWHRAHHPNLPLPPSRLRQTTRDFHAAYLAACEDLGAPPVRPLTDALDAAASTNSELYFLKLNGNSKSLFADRLAAPHAKAVAAALDANTTIAELDLSYNNIDDEGVAALADALRRNRALLRLDLRGNDVGAAGCAALASALSDPAGEAALTDLNLNGNPIGDDGAVALADMLRVNTTLLDLDVGNCDVGVRGVVAVLSAVNEDNATLESLGLENPRVPTVQEEHAWHAAKMLGNNGTLRTLKCGKWRLGRDGLETIVAYGLCANATLEVLDLRCNKIDEAGGEHVARALRENASLRCLNLEENRLGDVGAASIARALPSSTSLRELDVRCNGVGDEGLVALAEGVARMEQKPALVRLWGNEFRPGSDAAKAWWNLLRECERAGTPIKADVTCRVVDGTVHVARMTEIGIKEVGNTF